MKKNMAAAQTMRALLSALLGALIVLSAVEAKGQFRPSVVQPPQQLFPWGSSNVLTAFAVTNTLWMTAGVYGESSPGIQSNVRSGSAIIGPNTFTSKADIDSAFQEVLAFAGQQAITNTSPAVNKNLPLLVLGYSFNDYYPPNLGTIPFEIDDVPFSLVNSNGTWVLPNLSGIKLVLMPQLLFYIPGLEWGRIEVYNSTNMVTPFLVVDSRNSSSSTATNGIDLVNQAITIATPYLASGTNGPYRLKVSTLTSGGGFQVVDGTGMLISPTPFTITNFAVRNGTASLNVSGGDVGSVFVVEHSPDLIHWVPVGGPYTASTNSVSFQEAVFSSAASAPVMSIQNFAVKNGNATFKVAGVRTNMVFSVEESSDLCSWANIGAPQYPTGTNAMSLSEPMGSATSGFFRTAVMPNMFYRTVTTNAVPQ